MPMFPRARQIVSCVPVELPCGAEPLSAVEIPQLLLIVLLSAFNRGEGADTTARMSLAVRHVARSADTNPCRFAPEPFFDALYGLRSDKRFAPFAQRIFKTTSGQAYVPARGDVATILALRADLMIARHVTESYARANASALRRSLGRDVSLADIYLAHRVGLRFATEVLDHARRTPHALAALVMPDLDGLAPDLVFADDRALSFREILTKIEQGLADACRDHGSSLAQCRQAITPARLIARASPIEPKVRKADRPPGWQVQIERIAPATIAAR